MPYLHEIDPIAFALPTFSFTLFGHAFTITPAVHWYGLMYLLAFFVGWWIGRERVRAGRLGITEDQYSDLIFYAMLGVILGGRIGYMIFYGTHDLIASPLSLFRVWEGGMSFHGGLLGVLVALWWWSRKNQRAFWDTVDFLAPLVPPGLGFGRLGNFIGGELWGKHTDAPWGVIFPRALPDPTLPPEAVRALYAAGQLTAEARHPSQLYEFFLEGIVMFTVLMLFSRKPRPRYAVSGLFALMYGTFRFLIEFVREPDAQLGYLALGWVTMGQVLSLPLIAIGIALLLASRRASTKV
jgi:phosphatidylglycerol:prolipoprotein diacylglycerol transferase